jgi:hypothetical protein
MTILFFIPAILSTPLKPTEGLNGPPVRFSVFRETAGPSTEPALSEVEGVGSPMRPGMTNTFNAANSTYMAGIHLPFIFCFQDIHAAL